MCATWQTLTELIDARASSQGSIHALAKSAGIPFRSLYNWRNGVVMPSRLAIPGLAAALGITQADLEALVAAERSARRAASNLIDA